MIRGHESVESNGSIAISRVLTLDHLRAFWTSQTQPQQRVVVFDGPDERKFESNLQCFSNFHKQPEFQFIVPEYLCSDRMQLQARERTVMCAFSEMAIMLCKAAVMGDLDSYWRIARAKRPDEAKHYGRQVKGFDQKRWEKVVCAVAFHLVYEKFVQTPELQDSLLATGSSFIAEANDKVWGNGLRKGDERELMPCQWRGSNVRWALMETRDSLRRLRALKLYTTTAQGSPRDPHGELRGKLNGYPRG